MLSIIENYSSVEGKINEVNFHCNLCGFMQLKILLNQGLQVKEFPNLADADVGNSITINRKKKLCQQKIKAAGQLYFSR